MGNSFSTNAMAAKARAMYGNRLTVGDYQELLHRRSVNEIAAYLKNETYYASSLEGINEHSIHRGHLEMLIRQSYYLRFLKLMRFGSNHKSSFLQYGIIQVEIKQILFTIRSLKDTERYTQVAQMPVTLNNYTSFDLTKLLHVSDFDGLLELVKNTIYYPVLQKLRPTKAEPLDYTTCEIALKNLYYAHINTVIDKEFAGKSKDEMKSLFGFQVELDNITKIYRLKKYYESSADDIKKVITPSFQRIPKAVMYEWIENLNANEFLEALSNSIYKNYIAKKDFVYIEYHMSAIKFNLSKHNMRFASNPDIVLISYLLVLETEMQNLIDIIEGIRYNVDADKIAKLLIY